MVAGRRGWRHQFSGSDTPLLQFIPSARAILYLCAQGLFLREGGATYA